MRRQRQSKQTSVELTDPPTLSINPGVTQDEKKDLLSLCEDKIISEIYQEYFEKLPVGIHAEEDDSEED